MGIPGIGPGSQSEGTFSKAEWSDRARLDARTSSSARYHSCCLSKKSSLLTLHERPAGVKQIRHCTYPRIPSSGATNHLFSPWNRAATGDCAFREMQPPLLVLRSNCG